MSEGNVSTAAIKPLIAIRLNFDGVHLLIPSKQVA
jgi:hypothetical protein